MKIGIDARPLRKPYSGIGKYLEQILRVLAEHDIENEYYLYSHQDFTLNFPVGARWFKRIGWGGVGTIWLHTQLPFMISRDNLDIFWGPQYAIPLWPTGLPKVVTVHDLVFHFYPETLPTLILLHNKYALRYYLRAAKKVIVDSYSTKSDLKKVFNVDDSRIQVVHLAAGYVGKGDIPNTPCEDVLKKIGVNPGYILYVGTVEPRKNISRLMEAYSRIKTLKGINVPLVIVGGLGWKYQGILNRVDELELREHVFFTGYVNETELDQLYSNASIFVYPSLYEGFGLPPLEAMLRGIPIITSNSSSLPEVVGNVGLMVDPFNVDELAKAIQTLFEDENIRKSFSNKGIERAREFSWEKTAAMTLDILKEVVEKKGSPYF